MLRRVTCPVTNKKKLSKSLGLFDLVQLYVSAIVGFSSLALAAQFGWGSLLLMLLSILLFVIPGILMVVDLNTRIPEEGGFYVWTKKAFGEWHGFVGAWCYWLGNLVWFPSVIVSAAFVSLYAFGDQYLYLSDNTIYNGIFGLGILWFVVILNVIGLEKAKWIQNIGGLAIWLLVISLFALGGIYLLQFGTIEKIEPQKFIPDLGDFSILPFFATITFSWAGFELAPIMAKEIKSPVKAIPRALYISLLITALVYILGIAVMVITIPEGEIGIIEGVAQAFRNIGVELGISTIGSFGAIFLTISMLGSFGAWLTGNARIPFVMGIDRYLPAALGNLHPRWNSPYVSLLMQGALITLFLIFSIAGSTIKEAFLILTDMSIILFFIPYLYMFSAYWVHNQRKTGDKGTGLAAKRSNLVIFVIAATGLLTTLFTILISAVPSKEIENKTLFIVKVIGGSILLIALGLTFYYRNRRKSTGL